MAELLELTVAQAAERIRSKELSAEEYFGAYRDAAAADALGAFLWRAEEAGQVVDGELSGIPVAIKDIFCTEGIATTAGSRILEGYVPPYTSTAVRNLAEAGASVLGKTNMDEFAMGSSNENSGYGAREESLGHGPRARRLLGWLRGGCGRPPGALRHRDGHGRLDPPARGRCAGSSA